MFATGALAALALALTFALEKGWLTVGLALMAPGAAWVAEKRPLPLAPLDCRDYGRNYRNGTRSAYEPRIVGSDLGTTPIFNWLLYGYGSRRHRSGSRDGCYGGALTICRRASSTPAPSFSRCCSRSWKSVITSPAATFTGR